MKVENYETAVLKWVHDDPASGGRPSWYFNCGNFITLAEMFNLGAERLSCYDLYLMYKSLPVWIRKGVHSTASAPDQYMRNHAKKVALWKGNTAGRDEPLAVVTCESAS